jgi:hypothetical protein
MTTQLIINHDSKRIIQKKRQDLIQFLAKEIKELSRKRLTMPIKLYQL